MTPVTKPWPSCLCGNVFIVERTQSLAALNVSATEGSHILMSQEGGGFVSTFVWIFKTTFLQL